MKFYEFITVTIIFVILLAGILIGGELNKSSDVQNTYNAELIEKQRNEGVSLDINGSKMKKFKKYIRLQELFQRMNLHIFRN